MQIQAFDSFHADSFMQICTEVNARCADNSRDSPCALWHLGKMGLSSKIKEWLQKNHPNQSELGRLSSVGASQINRLFKGQSVGYEQVCAILEAVGAKIVFPDEAKDTTRRVVWVSPKRTLAVQDSPANPDAIRYAAVPLAEGQVAAGPGLIPEDSVRGWILALKEHSSIRYRSNLVAVEIGKGQMSMVPTLHPLDIVLVDRDDAKPEPDGSIFLVRDPDDGVAVKRVYVQRKNGGTLLQFVSDNPDKREYPPMVFDLATDYHGDIGRAIVGRVVWAWSDMTRK